MRSIRKKIILIAISCVYLQKTKKIMKVRKNKKCIKDQDFTNILNSIKDINSFTKKEIESIKNGDSFVRVSSQELKENRVPSYTFLI